MVNESVDIVLLLLGPSFVLKLLNNLQFFKVIGKEVITVLIRCSVIFSADLTHELLIVAVDTLLSILGSLSIPFLPLVLAFYRSH